MRLIDADALTSYVRQHWEELYPKDGATIDAILVAPTVDAVPVKHGRWIRTPYTDYDDTYECSVCGDSWTFIEGTPKDNEAYYCPHCGAKMDEVTDGV